MGIKLSDYIDEKTEPTTEEVLIAMVASHKISLIEALDYMDKQTLEEYNGENARDTRSSRTV